MAMCQGKNAHSRDLVYFDSGSHAVRQDMAHLSGFERLPEEILREIIQRVLEDHAPSLPSLMQVNKSTRLLATRHGLRSVRIQLTTAARTRQEVDFFLDACRHCDGLGLVRWLQIQGNGDVTTRENGRQHQIDCEIKQAQSLPWSIRNYLYLGDTQTYHPRRDPRCESEDSPSEDTETGNTDWQSVVDLLKELHSLDDFVWSTSVALPPMILDALQQHLPACRFHLPIYSHSFTTQNLDRIKPHDKAVLLSPQLSSIGLAWLPRDPAAFDIVHCEAVHSLVNGTAPNSRPIRFPELRPPQRHIGYHAVLRRHDTPSSALSNDPWCYTTRHQGKASLESLSLLTPSPTFVPMLKRWHGLTTFEALVELNLGPLLGHIAAAWVFQKDIFPSLKRLSIRNTGWADAQSMAFFATLRPLERLQLQGPYSPDVLSEVIRRHGPTLRSLGLPYREHKLEMFWSRQRTTLGLISHIRDHCPLLEEFVAAVTRNMSSRDELTMYQALASMTSVTRMIVMIDCSAPTVLRSEENASLLGIHGEYTEAWIREPFPPGDSCSAPDDSPYTFRNGDMCRHLINHAFDESLARSIWGLIGAQKLGRPLRSLELSLIKGEASGMDFTGARHSEVFEHFHRTYVIEGSVRDDGQGQIAFIREPGRKKREESERLLASSMLDAEPGLIMQVFRKIWPETEEGSDWRRDWNSPPLQPLQPRADVLPESQAAGHIWPWTGR